MKGKRIEGIVVKVTESTIVIMCHDGTFKNIPRSPEQIPRMGEPFSYIEREKRSRPSWSSYISVAAVFLMGILLYTLFLQAGPQASYVVAMDINPSMEVYVDQNDTVVKVVALNQDAEKVIKNIEFQHVALSQFLDDILSRSVEEGYLNKHTNGMVTTSIVPLLEKGQDLNVDKILENMQIKIEKSLEKHGVIAQVTVTSDQQGTIEEAHQMELSINKYKLYQRFVEKKLDITLEEVRTESVSQLLELEKAKEDRLKQGENGEQATTPGLNADQHNTKANAKHKERPASSDPSMDQSEERNELNQRSQSVEKEQRKKQGSQEAQNDQTTNSQKTTNNSEEQDKQNKQNKLDKPDKSDKQDETTNPTKQAAQSEETAGQEDEEQKEQTEQDEQTNDIDQEEDQQNQQEEEEPQEEDSLLEQEQDQSEGTTSENPTNVEGGSPPTNQGETSGRP